jgi:hypothetical protein
MYVIVFVLGLMLFVFAMLYYFGQSIVKELSSLKKEIEKIKGNCQFDEKFTKGILRKIETLTNEVHIGNYGDRSGLNILIFDDEIESTLMLSEKIRALKPGCKLITADNITNALYHLKMSGIDIVFADQRHNTEEYGTVLKQIMSEQEIKAKFVLYSGGPKPEKYEGPFLDKFEIMKNPDILKEYL